MKKIIHLIAYKNSPNIGDNFQTLTTKKVIESLGYTVKYVDRDEKDTDEKKIIFINGYYSPKTIENINVEFSKNTKAIFYNIHLAGDNGRMSYLKEHFLKNKRIYNSLKRFEPIGCRDEATSRLLNSVNLKAHNNECITLLMGKRTKKQAEGASKIILVDVDEFIPMPKGYNKDTVEYRSQVSDDWEKLSNTEKLDLSQDILDYYKDNAKLMITSRFHCAMPCIAMGIPVVFLGDKNSKRCEGLNKYIAVHDYIHFGSRTRTHIKKLYWSDKIPLLNRKVRYDFNILDLMYNIFLKIYIHVLYLLKIRKIDWDIIMPDIEKQKIDMIHKIEKSLKEI